MEPIGWGSDASGIAAAALAVAALVGASLQDVRTRLIANRHCALVALAGIVHAAPASVAQWGLLLVPPLMLFLAGWAANLSGAFGGGDVKLMTAIGFFVTPANAALMLFMLGVASLVVSAVCIASHRGDAAGAGLWSIRVPYGVALALAGCAGILHSTAAGGF